MKARSKNKIIANISLITIVMINIACTVVGPDYVRPSIVVPTSYKEAPQTTHSQTENNIVNPLWWTAYNDNVLDQLLTQIESQNYTLQSVRSRLLQTSSFADIARADKSPTLFAGGKNDLGILLNWELDLWGRVQRNIEANDASVQASVADLYATKLSLQAQLAQNYFLLRVQDADISLLEDTVASYERSLQITENQYAVGVADRDNIAQAQSQLSTAKVQMHNARIIRAQLEHTIAVLIGKAPSDFSLAVAPLDINVPEIPTTLPAALLERRPDIIAAERRMAVASAKIGIAAAQAYPAVNLFAGATIRKGLIGGGEIQMPLYTAGSTTGVRTAAVAEYEEIVANYRQTVLNGFKEVEDNMVELEILEQVADSQSEAVKAAREVVKVTNNQYNVGVTNYLSIVTVQASALINERAALNILGRRLVASVTLIKALGGGWQPES